MQYNTNQWIVLNYPMGAGGKFLATCLMQFDKIAHWAKRPLTLEDTIEWYTHSIPTNARDVWSLEEIDTPWVLPVSRTWPRGEHLSEQEFNLQLDNIDNQYFNQSWIEGKYILDFWHKSKHPQWWTNANWINIVVDDMPLYKKLIFSKILEYHPDKKIVILNDQRPTLGRLENQLQKSKFQNQWVWKNINNIEEFFENHITTLPWYANWDFNAKLPDNYILLSELFDVDKVYHYLLKYQDMFNQSINQNYISTIHKIWYKSTMERIS